MRLEQSSSSRRMVSSSSGNKNTVALKVASLMAFMGATSLATLPKKAGEVTREDVWGTDIEKFTRAAELVAEDNGTIKDEDFKIIDKDLEAIMSDNSKTRKKVGNYIEL